MTNIETIVRQINKELIPQFEEKLRAYLTTQNKEWLIEQIVRLTLDAHSLEENDRQRFLEDIAKRRAERIERLKNLSVDEQVLKKFLKRWDGITCEKLIQQGYLLDNAPAKGGDLEPIRKPPLSQKKMNFKVLTKCFFDGIAPLRLQKNMNSGS